MRAFCLIVMAMGFFCGGCGSSKFYGQWIEEGALTDAGVLLPVEGDRRQALRFEWPSRVRYGLYIDRANVVDQQSVQSATFSLDTRNGIAQFGATKARIEGDRLIAVAGSSVTRRFVKVEGRSIFPLRMQFPEWSQAAPPPDPAPAMDRASPGIAVASAAMKEGVR